jgi:ankyrin repeat protein
MVIKFLASVGKAMLVVVAIVVTLMVVGHCARQVELDNPRDGRQLITTIAERRVPQAIAAIKGGADVRGVSSTYGTSLHAAARLGNRHGSEELLALVLERAPDLLQARDSYGNTPLRIAAGEGSASAVKALLAAGANGHEPGLLHAAASHSPETVTLLIAAGALPNEAGSWGTTPLHRAAQQRDSLAAKALLAAGAKVNAPADNGMTPLHWAARMKDNAATVKLLLQHGADAEARDKAGLRPVDYASHNGHHGNVAVLSAGAKE